MIRALVQEAARLRETVNNSSFIILEQSREIDRMRAELSKQQGYAWAHLFGLRKFLKTPGDAQLKAQLFDGQLHSSGPDVLTRMAAFIKKSTEQTEGALREM